MSKGLKVLIGIMTTASLLGLGFISFNTAWVSPSFQESFDSRLLKLVLIVNAVCFFKFSQSSDESTTRRRMYSYLGFLTVVAILSFGFAPAVEGTKYQCYTESVLFYDYAEGCYSSISVETNDPQLCKEHVTTYSDCHTYFAGELGVAYECPDSMKDICNYWSATGEGGISLCASLPVAGGNIGRNSCYYQLALENNDPALCASIEPDNASGSENKNGYCYLILAEKTANPVLCDKIVDSTRKYECLLQFETK